MHSQMSCIKCSSKWFTFIYSWWGTFSKYKTKVQKYNDIFNNLRGLLEIWKASYLNELPRGRSRHILSIWYRFKCIKTATLNTNIPWTYLEGAWESIIFLFVLTLSIEFHWIAFSMSEYLILVIGMCKMLHKIYEWNIRGVYDQDINENL